MEVSWLVLLLLLPGIIALKFHDAITGTGRREFKHLLVSAALYVLVVYGVVFLLSLAGPLNLTPIPLGVEFNPWTIAWVLGVAVSVGWVAGLADEHRWLLRAVKRLGASRRGWRGTWVDSFLLRGRKQWACVYLKDGTRILGWPQHFSSPEEENVLFIARGKHASEPVRIWPPDRDQSYPIDGPGVLVAPAAEVSLVAFLEGSAEPVWEEQQAEAPHRGILA